MRPKILPQNSPMRRKLRFLARRFNVAVSPRLRKNFTQPTQDGIEQLKDLLKETYFPSWYKDVDLDGFYDSEEGRRAFDNHLFYRLELDRYEFIPWIDSVIRLSNAAVLSLRNPARLPKRVVARDGKREKLLNSYAPDRHRSFFRQNLNLVIQKLQ